MPTYSYRCPQCGDAFDIQQSFSDAALTACDRCGGALRKVFSPVGIAFKGSGFYRTDSAAPRKEGSPKTSEGSEKGKGSAGDGGSASSATQGAAKPAPAKSGD